MSKIKIKLTDTEINYILSFARDYQNMIELNPQDYTTEEWQNEMQICYNIIDWCEQNDK